MKARRLCSIERPTTSYLGDNTRTHILRVLELGDRVAPLGGGRDGNRRRSRISSRSTSEQCADTQHAGEDGPVHVCNVGVSGHNRVIGLNLER